MGILDNQQVKFRIRKYAAEIALVNQGILLLEDRVKLYEDSARQVVRAVIAVACQEEPVAKVPASWWQYFKQSKFPRWALKRWPVRYDEIMAAHKFPEVNIQTNPLGKEFVHLTVRVVPIEEMVN